MSYTITSVFATLQGEGINTGRRACFVRFTGCNLWNGTPGADRDKGKGACAKWCDTEFRDGKKMTADELQAVMSMAYPVVQPGIKRLAVLTGGEPTLQLDMDLINTLHQNGWEVAVETNGTNDPIEDGNYILDFVDHVAVSPKLMADGTVPTLAIDNDRLWEMDLSTELKVVLPGHVDPSKGWTSEGLHKMGAGVWDARFVQPMDPIDPAFVEVTTLKSGANDNGVHAECIALCLDFVANNPVWRVSLQTHKFMGLA